MHGQFFSVAGDKFRGAWSQGDEVLSNFNLDFYKWVLQEGQRQKVPVNWSQVNRRHVGSIKRLSSHIVLKDPECDLEIIQKLQCHLGVDPFHKNTFVCTICCFLPLRTPDTQRKVLLNLSAKHLLGMFCDWHFKIQKLIKQAFDLEKLLI